MVELCAYFNNYFFKIVYENFEHISLQSYGATLSICLPLEFITRFNSTNIHRNVCKSLKRQCPFWQFFCFKLNTWMKKCRFFVWSRESVRSRGWPKLPEINELIVSVWKMPLLNFLLFHFTHHWDGLTGYWVLSVRVAELITSGFCLIKTKLMYTPPPPEEFK